MKNLKLTTGGIWTQLLTLLLILFSLGCASSAPTPDKARAIDESVNTALGHFNAKLKGADNLVQSAKGALVFPEVIQGGAIAGGEYGEGALRIGGRTVGYYSIAAASFGLQLGAQKKDIIILFMDQNALNKFESRRDWTVGVDGAITLVTLGVGATANSIKSNQPVLGFVVGQAELMGGISLQGSKLTKLQSAAGSTQESGGTSPPGFVDR
jgi:lipid-binding SYLF domain-containing protein